MFVGEMGVTLAFVDSMVSSSSSCNEGWYDDVERGMGQLENPAFASNPYVGSAYDKKGVRVFLSAAK